MSAMTVPTATDSPAAPRDRSLWRRIDRRDLARTVVVAACAAAVALGLTWPRPEVPAVAVVVNCQLAPGVVLPFWETSLFTTTFAWQVMPRAKSSSSGFRADQLEVV